MLNPSFEEMWLRHGCRANILRELEPLVRELYEALVSDSIDLNNIRCTIDRLLSFLSSPAGRTDANCAAVDHFLCLSEFEWPELPDEIQDVLGDMAGALHDTVSSPEIACNFESTPEQLLARLRGQS